jgi:hypothetical protein
VSAPRFAAYNAQSGDLAETRSGIADDSNGVAQQFLTSILQQAPGAVDGSEDRT